jgi:hypothetical protein
VHDQAVGVDIEISTVRPIDQPFTNVRGKMRSGTDGFLLPFEI